MICLALVFWLSSSWADPQAFSFHVLSEPHTLDPQLTSTNSGNFFHSVLHRGLFKLHSRRGLELAGAKTCTRSNRDKTLLCQLNPLHKWSNGEGIVAADYVRSMQQLIDPERRSPQSDIVLKLKNAKAILAGKMGLEKLGVTAPSKFTVRFDFDSPDPDFEYKLTNPATAPKRQDEIWDKKNPGRMIVSGAYKIVQWKPGHGIQLAPNTHYGLTSNPTRPPLEILIIDNDSTALRMFEKGRLQFLRRLTLLEQPRFKNSPEFEQIYMVRFDYWGFGPALDAYPALREALLSAVDFASFPALVPLKGPMGCVGLSDAISGDPICIKFDAARAKKLMQGSTRPPKIEVFFSKMGGEDISQTAEWLQAQWKKNLGLRVELRSEEQLVYLNRLRTSPPMIFRKGLGLDRPTCLAALETFTDDNPENFLKIQDGQLNQLVQQLGTTKDPTSRLALCRRGLKRLLGLNRLIPNGKIHFSILARPTFAGWDLNELHQLDLSELVRTNPDLKANGKNSE